MVKLPTRRMVELEEPEIVARDAGKLTPSEALTPRVPERIREPQGLEAVSKALEGRTGGKVLPAPSDLAPAGPIPRSGPEGTRPTSEQPFFIEGEAARRTILVKVIPDYPAGVNKEAVVRIRFSVLPSGLVGKAVLLKKGGEAALEQLTLEAFRQWRFNPLPADVPQVEQEGIITFRWILR